MGEFSFYNILFLVATALPFIMFVIRPPNFDLMNIVRHFMGWFMAGFAVFLIVLNIGSRIENKTETEKTISAPVIQQPASKGVELI